MFIRVETLTISVFIQHEMGTTLKMPGHMRKEVRLIRERFCPNIQSFFYIEMKF